MYPHARVANEVGMVPADLDIENGGSLGPSFNTTYNCLVVRCRLKAFTRQQIAYGDPRLAVKRIHWVPWRHAQRTIMSNQVDIQHLGCFGYEPAGDDRSTPRDRTIACLD
jgi:hypothetical protein